MNKAESQVPGTTIFCVTCGVPLEAAKVKFGYAGGTFPVELLKCPKCELVFVPEELALGKMQKVEKALEDK